MGSTGLTCPSSRAVRGSRLTTRAWGLVLFLLLAALAGPSWWAAATLGRWLVVADPLEPADAIVVLDGNAPLRAAEAAAIFHAGWAREVWLTRGLKPDADVAAARKADSVHAADEQASRAVLERLGVPPSAIRVVLPEARNTMEELRVVARELARSGGERVIVVTSKAHTRRVRTTWQIVGRSAGRAIVRYARLDPFDGTVWWERAEERSIVRHEVLGLVNAWMGFPVRPAAARAPARVVR